MPGPNQGTKCYGQLSELRCHCKSVVVALRSGGGLNVTSQGQIAVGYLSGANPNLSKSMKVRMETYALESG